MRHPPPRKGPAWQRYADRPQLLRQGAVCLIVALLHLAGVRYA